MRLLRVPVESICMGDNVLGREGSHYVLHVHRLRPGMPVILCDALHGIEADATLSSATAKTATCHVKALRQARAVPTHAVTLMQCLAKGDKLDRVVRDATALGATRIVVVAAIRSVVLVDASESEARRQRWTRIAIEAARQSGRGNIPEILGPLDLDDGANQVTDCPLRLLMSPQAPKRLSTLLCRCEVQPIALCIGPEGGLEAAEEELLVSRGFQTVRFGDFTLRTETAATAALGALVDWGAR